MARNAFQSWLLRTRIQCDIFFDPEKLDPDEAYIESNASVNRRFSALPVSQRDALRAHFKGPAPLPLFPLRFYELSNPDSEWGPRKFGFHWEYDRPERKIEMKRLALAGFDLNRLGDTYYTFTQLRELRRAHERGVDIEPLLDNRYNRFQMMVLTKALEEGYDISDYSDPSYYAYSMASCFAAQVENYMLDMVHEKSALVEEVELVDDIARELARDEMEPMPLATRLAAAQELANLAAGKQENKVLNFQVAAQRAQGMDAGR